MLVRQCDITMAGRLALGHCRAIIIPDVMELATLADVRALVEKHLPADIA